MGVKQKICESCHGSGQVSCFKGVSRFLLSTEECPECGGLGFIPPAGAAAKKSSKRKVKDQ